MTKVTRFGRAAIVAFALIGTAAHADPVIQEHFNFVDHNFGFGDRPFALSVMRDGNQELAGFVALDDKGKPVVVTFTTPEEWQRFLGVWRQAKVALEANDQTMQVWSYTDSAQTKLSMMMNIYGHLGLDIEQSGAAVSMFDLTKEQVPDFEAALTKISAHFDSEQ
jgi:hypothetical protein